MRNTIIIFTLLFSFIFSSFSPSGKNGHEHDFHCNFYGGGIKNNLTTYKADAKAEEAVNAILNIVGLKRNFELKAANVDNASAVVYGGKRYILYNPKFMEAVHRASKTNWSSVSILAHEIGHHLNGHTLQGGGSRPTIELEADEFSGFVLRKMGANLSEAQGAMSVIASTNASKTHPGRAARLKAIETGWINADAQLAGNGTYKPEPIAGGTVKPAASPVTASLPAAYLASKVKLYSYSKNNFYVTVKNNLITYKGNEILVLGKVTKNSSSKYPYAIKWADNSSVSYISGSGKIYSKAGKVIGEVVV